MKTISALLAAAALLGMAAGSLGASAPLPDLRLIDAMAPASRAGSDTAIVYLSVHNVGGHVDRLLDGQSSRASHVRFYDLRRGLPGVLVEQGIDAPIGGSIDFASNGMQLRLEGLNRPLKQGEHFTLTLRFRDAGALSTEVQVGAPERQPGAPRH